MSVRRRLDMEEFIICIDNGNIVQVPFDGSDSGYYPNYLDEKILCNREEIDPAFKYEDYGILVDCFNMEISLIKDTFDGFQPVINGIDVDAEMGIKIIKQYLKCI